MKEGATDNGRTFKVASYNVENLFDQRDDGINQFYDKYRLKPNRKGKFSNYGDKVRFQGKNRTFTDIKILGVYKTLLGIGGGGETPEIVCFQELETESVLESLFYMLEEESGYVDWAYSDWSEWEEGKRMPINIGCLTKFPIEEVFPIFIPSRHNQRPALAMTVDVEGSSFTVINNHWRSKAVPESARLDAGKEIGEYLRSWDDDVDYVVLGDLNSSYDENRRMSPSQNDTNGKTGINDGLHAHSNVTKVRRGGDDAGTFNLNFELRKADRGTAYHGRWNNLDHMIVGPSSFDKKGVDYKSRSYRIARPSMDGLDHLFDEKDRPKRWIIKKDGRNKSRHLPGGFSDHLPIFAEFKIN